MKPVWPITTLGEVCRFLGGGTPSTTVEDYWRGDIPWVSPKDMKSEVVYDSIDRISEAAIQSSAATLIPKGSILIVVRSGILKRTIPIALAGRTLTINQDLKALCPSETVDPRFLYYLLKSKTGELLGVVSRGATVHRIPTDRVRNLTFALPPLPEQHRIVRILGEAFAAIAKAKANTEKNLQNARALFKSELRLVFSPLLMQTTVPIGTVATIYDGPHATPRTVEVGPIFLGISALLDGRVNLGQTRHVTTRDFEKWTRRIKPKANDIVFSYETRLGQAALIPEGLDCCLGRRMGLIRVDEKHVLARFLVYQYISPAFQNYLNGKVLKGATVDRISIRDFPSFKISLPSLQEQEQIADRIETIRQQSERLEVSYRQKLAALDALKQSLLHQAFSGNL